MTEREKLKERLWAYRYAALFGFSAIVLGGFVGLLRGGDLPLVAMLTGAIVWAWFGSAATSVERRLKNKTGL